MRAILICSTLAILCFSAAAAYSEDALDAPVPLPGWPEREVLVQREGGEAARLRMPDVRPRWTDCDCRQEVSARLKSYQLVGGGHPIQLWNYMSGVEGGSTPIEIFVQLLSDTGASTLEIVDAEGEIVRRADLPLHWSYHRVRLGVGQTLRVRVPEPDTSDTVRAEVSASWSLEARD